MDLKRNVCCCFLGTNLYWMPYSRRGAVQILSNSFKFLLKHVSTLNAVLYFSYCKMQTFLFLFTFVVYSDSAEGLQNGLDSLSIYCQKWKLKINVMKTKIIVFRKVGILPRNLQFTFNGERLEIVVFFLFRCCLFLCWLF